MSAFLIHLSLAVSLLSPSGASPVRSLPPSLESRLEPRKPVDCYGNGTFDASCWNTLRINDFLRKWVQDHKCGTIVTRDATGDCCDEKEPWANCFIRIEKGKRGYDCTGINPQKCAWDDQQLDRTSENAPKISYVLYGIYSESCPASASCFLRAGF